MGKFLIVYIEPETKILKKFKKTCARIEYKIFLKYNRWIEFSESKNNFLQYRVNASQYIFERCRFRSPIQTGGLGPPDLFICIPYIIENTPLYKEFLYIEYSNGLYLRIFVYVCNSDGIKYKREIGWANKKGDRT